jgi:hypothetical protein
MGSVYPPIRNGKPCSPILSRYNDGSTIMNYTCVLCNESLCLYSASWQIPEEDKEVWKQYQKEIAEYNEKHANLIGVKEMR